MLSAEATSMSVTQLEEDNRALRQQLEKLRHELHERNESQEIAILREQLQVFKDDFIAEKRDREIAVAQLAETEAELYRTKQQLKQQNLQTMQSIAERRQAALDYYRQQYEQEHGHEAQNNESTWTNRHSAGEDEIDGVRQMRPAPATSKSGH